MKRGDPEVPSVTDELDRTSQVRVARRRRTRPIKTSPPKATAERAIVEGSGTRRKLPLASDWNNTSGPPPAPVKPPFKVPTFGVCPCTLLPGSTCSNGVLFEVLKSMEAIGAP